MPMVFSVTRAWSFTPAPVVCIRCGAGLTCLNNTRFAFASFEVSWPCPCPIRFISCFSIRIFGLCKNFRFILRSICVNCFMKLTSSRRTLTYDVGQIAPKKTWLLHFQQVMRFRVHVVVHGAVLPASPAHPAPATGRFVRQPGARLHQRPLLLAQPARRRLQPRERPVWVTKRVPTSGPHALRTQR